MVLELTGNISWLRPKTTLRMQKVSPKQILKRISNLVQQLLLDQRLFFFQHQLWEIMRMMEMMTMVMTMVTGSMVSN